MKRYLALFLAAVPAFLWMGCASSGKAVLLAQKDPIALVSVVSNGDINWKDEEAVNPDRAGPLARRVLRADPDMTVASASDELINRAETLFREQMTASGLISFAEKEMVNNSLAYREARLNRFQVAREDLCPEGYRLVDYRDKDFPRALAAETGIQRSMYLDFKFTKIMNSGFGKNGTIRGNVEMAVLILDAEGKTIYQKTFSLGSRDTIKVSSGVYSRSGLMEIFEPAITDIYYEFQDHLSY